MKRTYHFALLVAMLLSVLPLRAQNTRLDDDVKQSGDILNNLDSLLNLWYLKNTHHTKAKKAENIYGYRPDEVPTFPDSVYAQRVNKIVSPLPYTYNSKVKGFIDLYAVRKRQQVERMLGLSEFYFPVFEEVLDKYNLPLEIKYLAVVESALNPRAVSHCGATGLWQFMYHTGVMYKLEVNSYYDDRRDPYQATEAAALFLKDLHNVFGDWFLAIAAYNCGPGNVNKAIRRSGGKRTFWEIYPYLPAETRGYVPAFIAASYVFTYHREHNLYPMEINLPRMVDTVYLDKEVNFKIISQVLDIDIDLLRDLNPQYKKDFIPARNRKQFLRLPAKKAYAFSTLKDSIYIAYENYLHPHKNIVVINDTSQNKAKENAFAQNNEELYTPVKESAPEDNDGHVRKVKVYYTVKAGDNLGAIADWFDVSIYSVRRWNGMKSNKVNVGRRLSIMVPADKASHYRKINTLSQLQKKKLTAPHISDDKQIAKNETKPEVKPEPQKQKLKTSTDGRRFEYYVVQRGDTLWSIAQRYPGVTVEEIKKLNGIRDNRSLQAGQKIKIQKG